MDIDNGPVTKPDKAYVLIQAYHYDEVEKAINARSEQGYVLHSLIESHAHGFPFYAVMELPKIEIKVVPSMADGWWHSLTDRQREVALDAIKADMGGS